MSSAALDETSGADMFLRPRPYNSKDSTAIRSWQCPVSESRRAGESGLSPPPLSGVFTDIRWWRRPPGRWSVWAGVQFGARLPMRRLVHSGKWLGRASGRIIGEQDAVLGQFPYQVSLQYVTLNEFHIVVCDGALITTTRVLTAAHCAGGVMYAFAGIVNLDTYEGAVQESMVLEQIYHPDYPVGFAGIYPNDIAVFTLKTAFTLNDYVQTISLPSTGSIPTADSPAVTSSWGGSAGRLLWANATIIDYETCRELVDSMGVVGENFVVDTMVCTLPVTGNSGLCGGDAGNPLVQDGVVIGVGQWFHAYCATEVAPAGFTRVSAFIDFINQHL